MITVNMLEAKSQLSRLVDAIERGAEREIVIARNGKPVARLTAIEQSPAAQRLGAAKGRFEVPDNIDGANEEIARLVSGEASGSQNAGGEFD
jgi:antitoxin (DNA-binding transcriptional repressor) of toxin-antitoxin stability system